MSTITVRIRSFAWFAAAAMAVAAAPPTSGVLADDGDVDESFGVAGAVVAEGPLSHGQAMTATADGSIIVAGSQGKNDEPSSDVLLARFGVDGATDRTFGDEGFVIADVDGDPRTWDEVSAVTTHADGRIVVAGTTELTSDGSSYGGFLVRFLPDGSLDSSFSDDGSLSGSPVLGADSGLAAVAVQGDDRIVAAGSDGFDLLLVHTLPDGTPDPDFGVAGVATHDVEMFPRSMVHQADGRILVAGRQGSTVGRLARFDADGTLDASFGDGGVVTVDLGSGDPTISASTVFTEVTTQIDGRILVAGHFSEEFAPPSVFVMRFDVDGAPDPSFGSIGRVDMVPPADVAVGEFVEGLIAHADDKVVLATTAVSPAQPVVRRLESDGRPDPAFGDGGVLVMDPASRWGLGDAEGFGVVRTLRGALTVGFNAPSAATSQISLARVDNRDAVLRINVREAAGGKTVFGNLASALSTGPGFATAYACVDGPPVDDDGNYTKADLNYNGAVLNAMSNRIVTTADQNGDICIYTSSPTALIVDLNATADTAITPFPNRRTDTRDGDGILPAGSTLEINIPEAAGGTTVFGNLAAAGATGPGFATAYPCADGPPLDVNGNYTKADLNYNGSVLPAMSNRLITTADSNGDVCIYTSSATALVVDVNATVDDGITPVPNQRIDTRLSDLVLPAEIVYTVHVPEAIGGKTVFGNLASAGAAGPGFLTAYPCTDGPPLDANGDYARADLNYNGDVLPAMSNRLITTADADGDICIYTSADTALIVDINAVADTAITPIPDRRTDTR